MTDEEKIAKVEQALDGGEVAAEIRALAGIFVVCSLEAHEEEFLDRACDSLGENAFRKIWNEAKEKAKDEYYRERAEEEALAKLPGGPPEGSEGMKQKRRFRTIH